MTTVAVTEADVGTSIATDGILNTITFDNPPTEYGDWFTLVDDSSGSEVVIFNIQASTSYVSPGSKLLDNGTISFGNLVLKSISQGSQYTLDYTDQAAP